MIVFPNCKINFGLQIKEKRKDGYHNIETVFYPLSLKDGLEVIENKALQSATELTTSGLSINDEPGNNLCIKAYRLLKNAFPGLPSVKIHLHKSIPMGAGLGGGSADAAFTLVLLNKKYNLNLSSAQLMHHALRLGSDCPFFIINRPCVGTGRGEILSPVAIDLSAYRLLLVNPGIHVNTSLAFSEISNLSNRAALHNYKKSPKEIIQQPVDTWKGELVNDFENTVSDRHPPIKDIIQMLYRHGAVYASMSGSGSSVYGLFNKNSTPDISFKDKYFVQYFTL